MALWFPPPPMPLSSIIHYVGNSVIDNHSFDNTVLKYSINDILTLFSFSNSGNWANMLEVPYENKVLSDIFSLWTRFYVKSLQICCMSYFYLRLRNNRSLNDLSSFCSCNGRVHLSYVVHFSFLLTNTIY